MNLKKLKLDGLVMAEENTNVSGTQVIYLDFDGAEDVSYDNKTLGVHIDNIYVGHSNLTEEQQLAVMTDLNTKFAGTGVYFTAELPEAVEYSTIYVGKTDNFKPYGNFLGLSETIDAGNNNRSDNAFVLTTSNQLITETIAHEAGHLLGFQHSEASEGLSIASYALPVDAQVTLQVVNNFSSNTKYFSSNYSDDNVWLYAMNTGSSFTYVDDKGVQKTVTDGTAFQLSTVKNGTFTITNGPGSSKLFAALGATDPFVGANGPGVFDKDIPYALIEWTVGVNKNDNVDVSYEDTFAFPTKLTVKNSNGIVSNQATFKAGSTSETVIDSLKLALPVTPVGPSGDNYPLPGDVGWGPLVSTVSGLAEANRWIGSSKSWMSGKDSNSQGGIYLYAPSFNDYLGYLKTNETVLFPKDNNIKGWYIDYSGNGGYSFYLSVTGTDGKYGLQIHDIRYNTVGSSDNPTPPWTADPTAWTAIDGTITVTANGTAVPVTVTPAQGAPYTYDVTGNWADITIYSGASLINGDFTSGPIVTGTGAFGTGGAQSELNSTFLASISASIATGLLGNSFYMDAIQASQPSSTMYWFNELERGEFNTHLFSAGWAEGQEFYDPYWKTIADYTNMQGYLSPFNDRWSNFSPDFNLESNSSIAWSLGIPDSARNPNDDFNGDGCSDILLKHSTSQLGAWTDANTAEWNTFGNIPSGWDIAGIGDMNGNAISDVILLSTQGDVGMWAGGLSSNWTGFGSIGTEWTITAIGDFTGNGKDDLLLRYTNGYVGMWEGGTSWTGLAELSTDWEIVGVGDFDGTGTDDIVMQYTNGTIGMWMNSNPADWNNVGSISSTWEIAGVGDFSNDGKDDLLLHDTVGGTMGLWKDGNSTNWQNLGVLPSDWSVSGIGDFNADGSDDILLDSNQGHVGMWASGNSENWLGFGTFDSANWVISNSTQ
ncbi:MAG: hypothetical protein WC071_05785 [Victivallaceae bacterium]